MQNKISNAALFFKRIGSELMGMCATCVDNTSHAGNKSYVDLTEQPEEEFQCKVKE